jgi:hypothetical protein
VWESVVSSLWAATGKDTERSKNAMSTAENNRSDQGDDESDKIKKRIAEDMMSTLKDAMSDGKETSNLWMGYKNGKLVELGPEDFPLIIVDKNDG